MLIPADGVGAKQNWPWPAMAGQPFGFYLALGPAGLQRCQRVATGILGLEILLRMPTGAHGLPRMPTGITTARQLAGDGHGQLWPAMADQAMQLRPWHETRPPTMQPEA